MISLLSNLANNFAEGICKFKCKDEHNKKTCETCENKYKGCECFLECKNFRDNLIDYKCL